MVIQDEAKSSNNIQKLTKARDTINIEGVHLILKLYHKDILISQDKCRLSYPSN